MLGVLYESYIHPITILSTLPSAGVGALLALLLFHQDLSVVAIIGIILLIGIVKKNGIMMVDFALEAERKEGKKPTEAIYQACLLRFRPIMMTTMAALLGGVPLALGTGIGSELRRPLGITIVGGLLLSQVLTLYTTPVIYIFFDRLAAALRPASEPPVQRRRCGQDRPERRHEPLRAIHPPAGGHHAADRGHRPGRPIAYHGAAGLAAAPGGFPTISVGASLPGASPETMASSVATPLERQFGHIAGVTEMTSHSSWAPPPSPCSSTSAGTSTPRPATCRRPSTPPAAICPPTCPATPPTARSTPPTRPSWSWPDLGRLWPRPDLRRGLHHPRAEALPDGGRGQVTVGGGALPARARGRQPTQLNKYGLGLTDAAVHAGLQNANRPKGQFANGE